MTVYKSVLDLIGNTPVLNLEGINSDVYLKLEGKNPGGSIKDRAVLGMIEDAEKNGKLKKGDIIVEATSGNTGIAVAMLANLKGYKAVIVMPESMSEERKALIKAYGAELVLTEGAKGMQGSVDKMRELMEEHKEYVSLDQFNNPSNPDYHYKTTGPEILEDVKDIDIFVAGVGTSGTLSGIAQYLKENKKDVYVVAVEPATSQVLAGKDAGAHKIQGIGANFVPENYRKEYIDEVMPIENEEAFDAMRKLGSELGVLVGISSGANVAAALKLSERYPGKKIVTVSPDGVEKYISMGIF